MTKAHAVLSPSSAHRWSACSASIAMESKYPDTSSVYAQEGTVAHSILEECLKNNCDAKEFKGQKRVIEDSTFEVNSEMVSSVQLCLDYVRSFDGSITTETTFSLEAVTGETSGQGTVDVVIDCGDVWHIVDLKYGAGVAVEAQDNQQLILYALGVLDAWSTFCGEPSKVVLTIVQPRVRGQDPIKTWEVTPDELHKRQKLFFESGQEALAIKKSNVIPYTAYQPSEKVCRFCKAKARCPALARTAVLATNQPLNNYELSKALDTLPLVEMYIKAVRHEAFRALNAGETIPDYTLKEGRKGNRTYRDEQEAKELLGRLFGDKAFRNVLISPAEMDKLVRVEDLSDEDRSKLEQLVIRPEGKQQVTRYETENLKIANISEFNKVA
ncbi:hypothetical protein lam_653 [Candidatus Liberibacter americanus str. Sao Paulo]|uniref:DUF2800 domain-containing protein n=1 Tax=Candidatus Liberibacter americanus str. Sao Paulo TaxID=1261131 RepID=U6B4K4_9HYPH|nr:DUF2800 domain-containing protein [Candidatus Liberibacter americanus]AHA27999.1 hypothetical protein lam_653 [Candidatus Liberibacter americanus str. Sao Paulo]